MVALQVLLNQVNKDWKKLPDCLQPVCLGLLNINGGAPLLPLLEPFNLLMHTFCINPIDQSHMLQSSIPLASEFERLWLSSVLLREREGDGRPHIIKRNDLRLNEPVMLVREAAASKDGSTIPVVLICAFAAPTDSQASITH
jgi:hypothetical protein